MWRTAPIVQLFFLLFFIYNLSVVNSQDFGYRGEKGPTHWGEQYNTCKGKHQSPININTLDLLYVSMPPLKMVGFKTPPLVTSLTNNGHTVQVKMDSEPQPQVSGGPLHGVYEFAQLHFHWGENDTYGSEDTINSHSFPMGIHLVFYKKNYRSARTAMDYPDGLTVLSLFYEVSQEANPAYEEFTALLGTIPRTNDTTSFVNPPTIFDLIETDFSRYYSYNGSLTTPPCSEVVTWIDFEKPIPLSHDQIAMFRSLRDAEGNALTHNFRPIQPLNERIVLANSPHSEEPEYQPKFEDPPPVLPTFSFPTTNSMALPSENPSTMDVATSSSPPPSPLSSTDIVMTTDSLVFSTTEAPIASTPPPVINSVEPLSTTLPTTPGSSTPVKTTTTTLGKIAFPEPITELPGNKLEPEVVTHKTHKQDHLKQKSGQAKARPEIITLLFVTLCCCLGTM